MRNRGTKRLDKSPRATQLISVKMMFKHRNSDSRVLACFFSPCVCVYMYERAYCVFLIDNILKLFIMGKAYMHTEIERIYSDSPRTYHPLERVVITNPTSFVAPPISVLLG